MLNENPRIAIERIHHQTGFIDRRGHGGLPEVRVCFQGGQNVFQIQQKPSGRIMRVAPPFRGAGVGPFYDKPDFRANAGPMAEVDFVLQRNREFTAVEAKSGRTFSEKWCKGLRAISDLNGLQRRIVVYSHGPVMRTDDGIDVFPFDYFAGLLAENRL